MYYTKYIIKNVQNKDKLKTVVMLQKTQGSAVGLFDCKWYWGLLIFCWPCSAADFQIVTVTHWFTGSRVQLQISKNSCQLLRYKGSFAAEPCQKKEFKRFFFF